MQIPVQSSSSHHGPEPPAQAGLVRIQPAGHGGRLTVLAPRRPADGITHLPRVIRGSRCARVQSVPAASGPEEVEYSARAKPQILPCARSWVAGRAASLFGWVLESVHPGSSGRPESLTSRNRIARRRRRTAWLPHLIRFQRGLLAGPRFPFRTTPGQAHASRGQRP